MMNTRRLLYPAIAVIGIAGLGAYAYFAQRAPQGPTELSAASATAAAASSGAARKGGRSGTATGTAVTVEVAKVTAIKLQDDINAAGTIHSNEAVVLRPEVSGRITQLNFSDGQNVKKGQVLVAFDAAVNQAEVQQARAELGIAKANFTRNAELARQKFIAERVKEESAANVQVLEAKLALAQARLSKFQITAPFSGIVGIRTVSVGDYVKDGADLVNLEDISSVKVDFRIPEKFIDRVQKGQSLEVLVDALPGKPFSARVDAINPQVDSSGRSALLRGRIANPEGKLKPGMFARVKLILSERDNALVIPEEAIVPQGAKSTVWKIVDGKALRTEVKTGLRRDAKVEVVEGLQLGDMIVTAGQVRLTKDGTPIRIDQGSAQDEANTKQSDAKLARAKAADASGTPSLKN
jgi:membrane fusion protein (multidrug efflux system)